mmetsp:Transcript_69813/g.161497  ORF Transcript_69813/g.161497 Transcript_69813/m.161497 type:complete len:224 (-) Transcript_69813:17-688(-)
MACVRGVEDCHSLPGVGKPLAQGTAVSLCCLARPNSFLGNKRQQVLTSEEGLNLSPHTRTVRNKGRLTAWIIPERSPLLITPDSLRVGKQDHSWPLRVRGCLTQSSNRWIGGILGTGHELSCRNEHLAIFHSAQCLHLFDRAFCGHHDNAKLLLVSGQGLLDVRHGTVPPLNNRPLLGGDILCSTFPQSVVERSVDLDCRTDYVAHSTDHRCRHWSTTRSLSV